MTDPKNETNALAGSDVPTCSPLHWLWMTPLAIVISPIGTLFFTVAFSLSFEGCLKLIAAQICAFALIFIASNGGE